MLCPFIKGEKKKIKSFKHCLPRALPAFLLLTACRGCLLCWRVMTAKGKDLTCSQGSIPSGEGWWLINGLHGNSAEMLRSRRQRGPPQYSPVVPVMDHGGGLDAAGAASDTTVSKNMDCRIPVSHQCHQQAGAGIQAVRATPSSSGRWKQLELLAWGPTLAALPSKAIPGSEHGERFGSDAVGLRKEILGCV